MRRRALCVLSLGVLYVLPVQANAVVISKRAFMLPRLGSCFGVRLHAVVWRLPPVLKVVP